VELSQTTQLFRHIAAPSEPPYRGSQQPRKQGGKRDLASERTISANGIELFVREEGEGPLVVLCHG
jgi:hypothetical protein